MIAIFPILSLYSHNVYETAAKSLALPLGLATATTLIVWLALWGVSRDRQRAGLAVTLLVGLFYGFNYALDALNVVLEALSRLWVYRVSNVHPLTVTVCLVLAAVPMLVLIFRRLENPGLWSGRLNVFALILILLPSQRIATAWWREPAPPSLPGRGGLPLARRPRPPDVYYIVLDAYARSDVMKELFDFDNEPFLRRLEEKGFYVARQSRSNYCQTPLSLCSTLNCEYLDEMIGSQARDVNPLFARIRDNLVVKTLRPLGYKFVAYATGFDPTECPEADLYLGPRHPADNFQALLIRTTPLRFMSGQGVFWDYYTSIRERTHFILDHLPEIARDRAPTFTFAHIVSPHHPFVFGDNGEDVSPRGDNPYGVNAREALEFSRPEKYREGYRRQAIYLTKRVEQTIDAILARSPEPPIILLQSDHGSGFRHHLDDVEKTDLRERMSILNCYYLPNRNYEGLTPTVTPVNSFRAVFNNVFGAELPLLKDRSLFSTYSDPLEFIDVTARLNSERDRGRRYEPPEFYQGMVH